MSEVECEITYTAELNEDNREVDCVYATCKECGHETFSWGDGPDSVKRCLALMNEECPRCENNFYIEE